MLSNNGKNVRICVWQIRFFSLIFVDSFQTVYFFVDFSLFSTISRWKLSKSVFAREMTTSTTHRSTGFGWCLAIIIDVERQPHAKLFAVDVFNGFFCRLNVKRWWRGQNRYFLGCRCWRHNSFGFATVDQFTVTFCFKHIFCFFTTVLNVAENGRAFEQTYVYVPKKWNSQKIVIIMLAHQNESIDEERFLLLQTFLYGGNKCPVANATTKTRPLKENLKFKFGFHSIFFFFLIRSFHCIFGDWNKYQFIFYYSIQKSCRKQKINNTVPSFSSLVCII